MNRYPLWTYLLIGFALLIGVVYTLPNFFGEVPAIQVSTAKSTQKVDVESAAARRGGAQGLPTSRMTGCFSTR